MSRGIVFAAALLLLSSADAWAFGTYRAGSVVLDQGDSVTKVINAMGQPESKEPIFNRFGAQIGENWYYRDGRKTIKFEMSGGRVVIIEEIR